MSIKTVHRNSGCETGLRTFVYALLNDNLTLVVGDAERSKKYTEHAKELAASWLIRKREARRTGRPVKVAKKAA